MADLTRDEEIQYGQAIERVLRDSAYDAVMKNLRLKHVNDWVNSHELDQYKRESAWRMVRVIDELAIVLSAVVDAGRRAQTEQELADRE